MLPRKRQGFRDLSPERPAQAKGDPFQVAVTGLEGLGLGRHEDRIDLRGLPVPVPARLKRFAAQGWFVEALENLITFRGVTLEGLDLSGARLQSLRFFGSRITGCRLDRANCQDWRLWDTEVADCSFVRASLREAAVGTWHESRPNTWRRVDFTRADFRVGTCWEAVFGLPVAPQPYGQQAL